MIFYSLVFSYDLQKMEESGRHWASSAYKNADYIFSYSAASIATVMHHNPTIDYRILTDNVALLKSKLNLYTPSHPRIEDASERIKNWMSERSYCFWPAVRAFQEMFSTQARTVKLDCDLTCLRPLDAKFFDHKGSHVWKTERLCSAGREYWGERLCARTAFGTENFYTQNMGVFSVTPEMRNVIAELPVLTDLAASVDISSVSHFPERPGHRAKMWNCAEQTAVSYWLAKNNIAVLETTDYFLHHCYVNNKDDVLKHAKHLLK